MCIGVYVYRCVRMLLWGVSDFCGDVTIQRYKITIHIITKIHLLETRLFLPQTYFLATGLR